MGVTPYALQFLECMLLTQAVEVPVAWYLFSKLNRRPGVPGTPGRVVAAALLGNLATLPWLWFVYPQFMTYGNSVLWGEITAVGLEALLYQLIVGAGITSSLSVFGSCRVTVHAALGLRPNRKSAPPKVLYTYLQDQLFPVASPS